MTRLNLTEPAQLLPIVRIMVQPVTGKVFDHLIKKVVHIDVRDPTHEEKIVAQLCSHLWQSINTKLMVLFQLF